MLERTNSTASVTSSESEGYYTSSGSRDSTDSQDPSISSLTNSVSSILRSSPNISKRTTSTTSKRISRVIPSNLQMSLKINLTNVNNQAELKKEEEEICQYVKRPNILQVKKITTSAPAQRITQTSLAQTQPTPFNPNPTLTAEEREVARKAIYGIDIPVPKTNGASSDRFKRIASVQNSRMVCSAKEIMPSSRSENSSMLSHSPPRQKDNPIPQKVRRTSESETNNFRKSIKLSGSYILSLFKSSPRGSARELSSSSTSSSPSSSPKKHENKINVGLNVELSKDPPNSEQLKEARAQSLRTIVMDGKFLCDLYIKKGSQSLSSDEEGFELNKESKPLNLTSDKKGKEASQEILEKFLRQICEAGWTLSETSDKDFETRIKEEAEKLINLENSEFWPLLFRFNAGIYSTLREDYRKLLSPLFCKEDISRDICKIETVKGQKMRLDLTINGPLNFHLQRKIPCILTSRPNHKKLEISTDKRDTPDPNNNRYHIATFEIILNVTASTSGEYTFSDFLKAEEIVHLTKSTRKFIEKTLETQAGLILKNAESR